MSVISEAPIPAEESVVSPKPKLKVVLKLGLKPKFKVILKPNHMYDVSQATHGFHNSTWTFTFGDCIESHAKMQQIGQIAKDGFNLQEVDQAAQMARSRGFRVEVIDLQKNLPEALREASNVAKVIIIRQGIGLFLDQSEYTEFIKEVKATVPIVDKKAFMYGRVVDKHARHNLCYADQSQVADFANKKGTIIDFKDATYLQRIRQKLPEVFGAKANQLLAELNYYYDHNKCRIAFHGDVERRRVIGVRVGGTMNLQFQWYQNSKPVGSHEMIYLHNGDVYMMSEKAVGNDWNKKKIVTLRHGATGNGSLACAK